MSDAAFKSAPYAGYTTDQLSDAAHAATRNGETATADKMRSEIYRRERVKSGDMTDATPGERLRARQALTTKVNAARALGSVAFASDLCTAPAGDPELMTLLEGVAVGTGATEIMKAWLQGWTAANLASR